MNRGIVVAATGSGCGKTSIACGILRALRRKGMSVRAAKCGPDYLDPLWLSLAGGSPCPNLDPWMAGEDGVRRLAAGEGFLVVETAMGLYDGVRPDSDVGSGFEVARLLDLPVVLVVDASGAARTVAAVVQGLRDFGPARIAGVVANRVGSPRHAELVSEALASRDLPPLLGFATQGALPVLPGRHLGLVPPANAEGLLERLGEAVSSTVDLDRLVSLAGERILPRRIPSPRRDGGGLRLGLSWDEAFRFAYGPVVHHLEARGVEVVRFSPMGDPSLPEDLDGLWLCGGYPESHAAVLASNGSMRASIRDACAAGRPVLAECGGLLYLCEELVDLDGVAHPMCGVLPARGVLGSRMRALGYRTARPREDLFLAERGKALRGHEFHYGALEGEPRGDWRTAFDWEGARGASSEEGWWNGSVLATWFHGWLDDEETIGRWIASMRAARAKEG